MDTGRAMETALERGEKVRRSREKIRNHACHGGGIDHFDYIKTTLTDTLILKYRSRMLLLPLPLLAQRRPQRIPLRLRLQRQRLANLRRAIDHQRVHQNLFREHREW
jgi:hypothetical protein